MSSFDRITRPTLPEARATHLEEGFVFGAIPCEIVDLDDPEKLGRIRVTSKLFSENQVLPNSNDGWAWPIELTTEGNTTGGSYRLLRKGAQVICLAMLGDINNLFLLGCVVNRQEPPHPVFDRENEIYGSATRNGVITAKNDANQSRVDAYPHGVTQLVDGAGNITQTTANSATLSLREDGTASVQNPQGYTTHSPEGEVAQGNQAGAKQIIDPKGRIDLTSAAKSTLKLDEAVGRIEGPLDEISQLLQKAKGLIGSIAPALDKFNQLAKGIGLPESGDFVEQGFKALRNQLQDLTGKLGGLPEAIEVFGKLSSANPLQVGQLLGPQLDAIAPVQSLIPLTRQAFESHDPVTAVAQILPQLPTSLKSQLTPEVTERIFAEAIALQRQPDRQTESLISLALGDQFEAVQNVFGLGLGETLGKIREILPAAEAPTDFMAGLEQSIANGLTAVDPAGVIRTTPVTPAASLGDALGLAGAGSDGAVLVGGGNNGPITPPTREERLDSYESANAGPREQGIYWNDPATVKIPLARALYDRLPPEQRSEFAPDDFAVVGSAIGDIELFQVAGATGEGAGSAPQPLISDLPQSLGSAISDAAILAEFEPPPEFNPEIYRGGGSKLGSAIPTPPVDPNSPFYRALDDPAAGAVIKPGQGTVATTKSPITANRPSILPADAPPIAKQLEQLLPDLIQNNLKPEQLLAAATGQLPINDQLQGLVGLAMSSLSSKSVDTLSRIQGNLGMISPLTQAIGAIGKGQTSEAIAALSQVTQFSGAGNLAHQVIDGKPLGDWLRAGQLPSANAMAQEFLPKAMGAISGLVSGDLNKMLGQFNGLLNGLPIEHKGAVVEVRKHAAEILTDLRERGAKILVKKTTGALIGPLGRAGVFAGLGKAGIKTPFGELGLGETGGVLNTLGKMSMRSLEGRAPGLGGAGLELARGAASLSSFADAQGKTRDAEVTVADGAIRLAANKGIFVGDVDLMALVNSLTERITTLESSIAALQAQAPPSTNS
jgi:hypothetical protein